MTLEGFIELVRKALDDRAEIEDVDRIDDEPHTLAVTDADGEQFFVAIERA